MNIQEIMEKVERRVRRDEVQQRREALALAHAKSFTAARVALAGYRQEVAAIRAKAEQIPALNVGAAPDRVNKRIIDTPPDVPIPNVVCKTGIILRAARVAVDAWPARLDDATEAVENASRDIDMGRLPDMDAVSLTMSVLRDSLSRMGTSVRRANKIAPLICDFFDRRITSAQVWEAYNK